MNKGRFSLWHSLVVGVVVFLSLNALWFHIFRVSAVFGAAWEHELLQSSGKLHEWAVEALHWRSLAGDNEKLKAQVAANTANQAAISALTHENDQLRAAASMTSRLGRTTIPAGLFDVSLLPDGYTGNINRGTRDGVAVGDVVVDANKVLIGTVQYVFTDSARVTLISDPTFKVTAITLANSVKGIAHGALNVGMNLDLIVQADQITVGDVVVSSGVDTIPSGLVIGTVNHVEGNDAKIFKKVTIAPAADFGVGDVFVIH